MLRFRFVVGVLIALLAAASPARAQTAELLFQKRGVDAEGDLRLAVDQPALARLRAQPEKTVISVPLEELESVDLALEPFWVVAPDCRFVSAGRKSAVAMAKPDVLLMRGEIAGEPGSRAFLAFSDFGGSGSITRGNGRQFHLTPEFGIDGKPSGFTVRRGAMAAPDFDDFCVTIDERGVGAGGIAAGPPPTNAARGPRVLGVAIDSDQSFYQMFNNQAAAQAYIVQLVGAVSDIYMRDLDFKLVLRFSRLWPNGGEPFQATSLAGFRDYWQDNEDLTNLNLVHMFSGRRDLGYGGIAYLADACNQSGFAISAFLLGNLPSPVGLPHLGNWDVIVVAHEMGHNLGTPHTHSYNPPIDICTSGVNERGTIMSYCHTRPGGLLNIDLRMHARVEDFIADNNAGLPCLSSYDCNNNGLNDLDDILLGSSVDSNFNNIPDECEDCDGDGTLNDAEIAAGAPDINSNLVPDACESDCNANQIPDEWETAGPLASDLNGNRVPDECEPDCDANGVPDFTDIHDGTHDDLDRNAVLDICQDCNSNGLPDWIDVERQHNVFMGLSDGAVREYHALSGFPIGDVGVGAVNGAYDLVFGPDRQLYVTSFNDHRIARINVDTGAASDFVSAGAGGLENPSALTFGPNGDLIVASQATDSVLRYDGSTGAPLGAFVVSGSGALDSPWDIAFGPNGHLLVASNNNRILKYHGVSGAFLGVFTDALDGVIDLPRGMAFLASGELLVTNLGSNQVTRYDPQGAFLGVFNDEYPVDQPWGISVMPGGNVLIGRPPEQRVIEYDVNSGRYLRSFLRADEPISSATSFAFRPASPNDANGNNLPDECESLCPADITGDSVVNVNDLLMVIGNWGASGPNPADINGDQVVNVNDLLAVVSAWGPC